MTAPDPTPPEPGPDASLEDLKADMRRRPVKRLGETARALTHKLNVKARAGLSGRRGQGEGKWETSHHLRRLGRTRASRSPPSPSPRSVIGVVLWRRSGRSSPTAPSATAKLQYRPVGLVSSILGGLVARSIFLQISEAGQPGRQAGSADCVANRISFQGNLGGGRRAGCRVLSLVKTVINRQGARIFERWTGEWPGS